MDKITKSVTFWTHLFDFVEKIVFVNALFMYGRKNHNKRLQFCNQSIAKRTH